jgi:predicted kinase
VEAVIFIGLQGSGKTTFYQQRFAQSHGHVSLDAQKTRGQEQNRVNELIRDRQSFVVDNTNATVKERQRYIIPSKTAGYTVIGYYFDCPIADCLKRNQLRSGKGRIPPVGLYATRKRMQPPTLAEGFDHLFVVRVHPNAFECSPLSEGQVSPRGIP